MPSKLVQSYIRDAVETISPAEMTELQLQRLQAGIDRISKTVPFYATRLKGVGIGGKSIRSMDDLDKLPFTTKADLRDNYPFGLLAVPMKEIVRIHASSGTTGKPTVVAYTETDVAMWSELMARTYAAAGVNADDVVQNAYGYGLFTGGLGFHYGAERLGAAVIPVSGGNTKRQLMIMRDFGSTVLCCTPPMPC
jgi:phenylacetate-CoA ligase